MTRDEFVENYLAAERAAYYADDANVRVSLALIGSIYDLQQQIAQLQDRVDELEGIKNQKRIDWLSKQ